MAHKNLMVIAHNNLGSSLSGGDQIFLNLIKYHPKDIIIHLFGSQEAINLTKKYHIRPDNIFRTDKISPITKLNTQNLFFHQLIRIRSMLSFVISHRHLFKHYQYIYTSSDFPSDSLFGVFAKIFNPKIVWLAGYYLAAPNPFSKNSPYVKSKHYFRGLIYRIGQIPVYLLIKLFSNHVCITSEPDRELFPNKSTLVVQGGVNLPDFQKYLSSHKYLSPSKRHYDAVFLGRLHVQKGVIELIDIWAKVVNKIPSAKLAIIGDGELKSQIVSKIKHNKLQSNIDLLGFLVGPRKVSVFQRAKIVVHPATYDSGGMAMAEAMSWGLPGVAFDLPALKTYYAKGVLKAKLNNLDDFSNKIILLVQNNDKYNQTSQRAIDFVTKNWGWETRLKSIYNVIH